MENLKNKINLLVEDTENYFKTREELTKLVAAEKGSRAASELFSGLIIFFVFLTVFLFLSFSLAYVIADYTGKTYYGFAAVTLMYLFIGILLYSNREKWLKIPMMNSVVKSFFKEQSHEQD
jgi:hypothetical protein